MSTSFLHLLFIFFLLLPWLFLLSICFPVLLPMALSFSFSLLSLPFPFYLSLALCYLFPRPSFLLLPPSIKTSLTSNVIPALPAGKALTKICFECKTHLESITITPAYCRDAQSFICSVIRFSSVSIHSTCNVFGSTTHYNRSTGIVFVTSVHLHVWPL